MAKYAQQEPLGLFEVMARKPKNPIDDIAKTVGGWLGGGAKSLNTFLTGDRNPTLNPQTRAGIRATQRGLDIASGGGVSAAQQGPGAFARYANTQIGLYGAGVVAPSAISAALQSAPGQYATRKAATVAANAAFHAKLLKPVTTRTVMKSQKELILALQEAQDVAEDARFYNEHLEQKIKGLERGAPYDEDYMDLYQRYNPVRHQAAEDIERLGDPLLSPGRENRMLLDTAESAYKGISSEMNADEIRFAKRALRERGKFLRGQREFSQSMDEYMRNETSEYARKKMAYEANKKAAERAKKLQRQLYISNARRNMPDIDMDPEDFDQ